MTIMIQNFAGQSIFSYVYFASADVQLKALCVHTVTTLIIKSRLRFNHVHPYLYTPNVKLIILGVFDTVQRMALCVTHSTVVLKS